MKPRNAKTSGPTVRELMERRRAKIRGEAGRTAAAPPRPTSPLPARAPAETGQVSVILTAWNQGRFIEEALWCWANQTYRPAEIVYADDGSDDDSVTRVAGRFPQVRVMQLPHRGQVASRNTAYARLRSEPKDSQFVVFADGDNMVSRDFLKAGVEALRRDKAAGIAYADILRFEQGDLGSVWRRAEYNHAPDHDWLAHRNYIDSTSVLRREAFEAAGGWEGDAETLFDWWLWQRITRLGWGLAKMPPSEFLLYRSHAGQSGRRRKDAAAMWRWHYSRLPFTIFTPFAEGRTRWSLDLWRENLRRSGARMDRAHLLVGDCQSDPAASRRMRDICEEIGPRSYTVFHKPNGAEHESLAFRRSPAMADFMCCLWRKAAPHFTGDFLWSLEDDVRAPEVAYFRLIDQMRPDVGIVGSPAVSRWRRPLEAMARRLTSAEPYALAMWDNGRFDYRGMRLAGAEDVGYLSMCSTLVRRSVLRGHVTAYSPNGDGRQSGHEHSLMRRCAQMPLRIVCDWDTPVDHMIDGEQALTLAQWRQEMAGDGYDYRRPPDLARIERAPKAN